MSQTQRKGLSRAIGDTKLIELPTLSKATGCTILAKCEQLNPGASVKDRAALKMIEEAEASGRLKPGMKILEATGGNTGVGLALVAAAKGYKATFTMPESISRAKIDTMARFGAEVILCTPCPITDSRNYQNVAKALYEADPTNILYTQQFDNAANPLAHYETTAPEIWAQSAEFVPFDAPEEKKSGWVDGFVCAAGTSGSIAGCSKYLKEKNPSAKCFLIDPPGSGLYGYVKSAYKSFKWDEATGRKLLDPLPGNTMCEGIGIKFVSKNFVLAEPYLDDAVTSDDNEIVAMCYYLLKNEGLWLGPSAALNVIGAVKMARMLGPGHTIATLICDGGASYVQKLYTASVLEEKGLTKAVNAGTSDDGSLAFVGA